MLNIITGRTGSGKTRLIRSMAKDIAENFNDLDLGKYYCVLKNVLHVSVRDITAKVFAKYLNEEEPCDEQSV